MRRLEVSKKRAVDHLSAARIVYFPERDAVGLGRKAFISQESAREREGAVSAEADHADAAPTGRRRESNDGVCCLHY